MSLKTNKHSSQDLKATLMVWVMVNMFLACSPMGGNSLPRDQFNQVEISDFEVNLQRDYIRGKIQNNGEHNITSSIFELKIYSNGPSVSGNTNLMNESSARRFTGDDPLDASNLLLSQNFVVREPLSPGYSTEFYFELKMDYEFSNFIYTYDLVQIKGR